MHLKGVINDVEAFVGGELLRHGAVHGVVGVLISDALSTVADHESTGFEVSGHFCELELNILITRDGLAELLSCFNVSCCEV